MVPAYLATNTIANSIAARIVPISGGKFADFFAGCEPPWALNYKGTTGEFSLPTLNLQQWDFLFAIAFLIGIYSIHPTPRRGGIHRLSMVKEADKAEEKVVVSELLAEMRNQVRTLSSVEGLR